MTFEQFEIQTIKHLNEHPVAILNDDNSIIAFISSIKDFGGRSEYKNGQELLGFLTGMSGVDTGFPFKLNGIIYLLYRFGTVGDTGYIMFVSNDTKLLLDYVQNLDRSNLNDEVIDGFISAVKSDFQQMNN